MSSDVAGPSYDRFRGLADDVAELVHTTEHLAGELGTLLDPTAALPLRRASAYLTDALHLLEVRAGGASTSHTEHPPRR